MKNQRREKVRDSNASRPAEPVSAGNEFFTDEHVVSLAMGEYEETQADDVKWQAS